jgi:hypothetical protein
MWGIAIQNPDSNVYLYVLEYHDVIEAITDCAMLNRYCRHSEWGDARYGSSCFVVPIPTYQEQRYPMLDLLHSALREE